MKATFHYRRNSAGQDVCISSYQYPADGYVNIELRTPRGMNEFSRHMPRHEAAVRLNSLRRLYPVKG